MMPVAEMPGTFWSLLQFSGLLNGRMHYFRRIAIMLYLFQLF